MLGTRIGRKAESSGQTRGVLREGSDESDHVEPSWYEARVERQIRSKYEVLGREFESMETR